MNLLIIVGFVIFASFIGFLIHITFKDDNSKKREYIVLKNTPKTWPEDLPPSNEDLPPSNQINPDIYGGIAYEDGKVYEKVVTSSYYNNNYTGTTTYENVYLPSNIKQLYDDARKEAEDRKILLERETIEEYEKDKESYKIAFTKFGDFLNIMAKRGKEEHSSAIYLKNILDITLIPGEGVRHTPWVFSFYQDTNDYKVYVVKPAHFPRKIFVGENENPSYDVARAREWVNNRDIFSAKVIKYLNQKIDFPVYASDDRIIFRGIGMLLVPYGLGQEVFDKIMKAQEIDIGK